MTKRFLLPCLALFCVLAGCGGQSAIQPSVVRDAESYTSEGMQAFNTAQWLRAQWLFNRALSLYEGIDNQQGVVTSHINLAEVALSMRDHEKAHRHLDRAAEISKDPSLQSFQSRVNLLYALNALKQNQVKEAENYLLPLLPVFDGVTPASVPDAVQLAAIANRTRIAFIREQNEKLWTQRYEKSLKRSTIENSAYEARLLRFQSDLLFQQGDYDKTETNLLLALSVYKTGLSRPGIAATLSELGSLYMTQGRWQDAQPILNRSIAVYRYLGDLTKVIQVAENLIIVEKELGNMANSQALSQWVIKMKEEHAAHPTFR